MSKVSKFASSAVIRQFLIVVFLVLAALGGSVRLSLADSAATGGSSGSSADGVNSGSTQTSSVSTTNSYAESIGKKFAHGHTTSSSSSTVNQNSDGSTTNVNAGTDANANATSENGQLNANASANQNGSTGANSTAGGVTSNASSSGSGLSANASSTTGSAASATAGKGVAPTASTSVVNGTTTTTTKGRKVISLSVADDGNFSLAIASRRGVRAVVGTTINVGSLTIDNIGSFLRSAMYAEANASFGNVSAYARAEISATANSAAQQARASGFSAAYASVKRRGNTLVVTVSTSSNNAPCMTNHKNKHKPKSCVLVKKVVQLGGKAKMMQLAKVVHAKPHARKYKKRH